LLYYPILLCCYTAGHAQYLEGLDPSYGNKGVSVIGAPALTYPQEFINGSLQPDGKIIALASRNVLRYQNDGRLDKGFGVNGVFAQTLRDDTGALMPYKIFHGMALQPDGKIVVVGESDSYSPLLLFRLSDDGTLDAGFGKGGVICNPDLGMNTASAVVLQPDGKIVLMGKTSFDGYQMLARYHSDGRIDSSFGINGKIINPLAETSGSEDIALMPDGRIVTFYDRFGVARYLPNGSLDTSFNHTGMKTLFSGSGAPYTHAMILRPDGKIWLAGHSFAFADITEFLVACFNADGSPDTSFDPLGYKTYTWDTGGENKCRDMFLLPDGKVIVGGRAMNKTTKRYSFCLMRLFPDGKEDSSFGINGRLLTTPNGARDGGAELNKLLVQADGRLLALGASGHLDSASSLATIVRYHANGKTGIAEASPEGNAAIQIYPNPADNLLFIENKSQLKISCIRVYDMLGVLVKQVDNPDKQPVDISDLPAASYVLSIQTEQGAALHRTFVVRH
jgi:uncharacterized delta-60 repeat protein